MKMEIDVFCILQNIVYGYFLITSFYIQLLLLTPVRTAQNRAYTRHQLTIVEGLRQVIIRAQLEAENAIQLAAAGS